MTCNYEVLRYHTLGITK